MSKDQGKKKIKPGQNQKQARATSEKQNPKSAELSDADLDKVAGGRMLLRPKDMP